MEWLLELMGHIRNIAYDGKSEPSGDTSAVCQRAGPVVILTLRFLH